MHHRMATGFGLGNPNQPQLNNIGKINNDLAENAIALYFQEEEGFDFTINDNYIMIGFEPAYQNDKLKIICISKDKGESFVRTGKAWGAYGTQIASNTKQYKDYKNKSKFVRFVDRWHKGLFDEKSD
ncbi:MAG: hypothetical protein ACTSU6_04815 [Candidatus Njordarchaeales archaeon]